MKTPKKSEFWKKYTHPLWQKKRLEILTRDNFRCSFCEDAESKLNIHHEYYVSGRNPWDYPDWSLLSLCDECHKLWHEQAECLTSAEVIVNAICPSINESDQAWAQRFGVALTKAVKSGFEYGKLMEFCSEFLEKLVIANREKKEAGK